MKMIFLLGTAAALLALSAHAEPNECVAGLLPNVTISTSSQQLDMAILKVIDEKTFRDFQRGGSGAAKFPIKAVPIEANGNYQEWDRKRREYLEVNRFNLSYDEAFLLVRREIPEVAYAAYKDCLVRGSNAPGIHIFIDDYTDKEAFVTIKWTPPPDVTGTLGPTTVTVEASGTSPEMAKLPPVTLGAGHSRQLTFPLVQSEPLVVSASTASGFSDRTKLDVSSSKLNFPATPPRKNPTVKDVILKALDEGKTCVARLGGDENWALANKYWNNVYEVRYLSADETWQSNGREDDARRSTQSHRGPSLAKGQVNIYNVLFALGEEGALTAVGPPLGRSNLSTGTLYCPFTEADLR